MLIQTNGFSFDLAQPIDISIPLHDGPDQPNCYYAPLFRTEPFVAGDFIGDIRKGSPVNYKNIYLNPHGNGTHTECLAHIADIDLSVHRALTTFHFLTQLITVQPQQLANGSAAITREQLETALQPGIQALVVRTLPNPADKFSRNYNNTNPPWFEPEALKYLSSAGIQHLLTDLPSVDPEVDGGKLLAHRAFWHYPEQPRLDATITEMVFVPDPVRDGIYLLNLQIPSFESDAAPSKPVLFRPV